MVFKSAFLTSLVIAMCVVVYANPVVGGVVSHAELIDFLATTEAEVTYIGEPIDNDISRRNALNTIVVYCDRRVDAVCGGHCTVYNGGPACLNSPGTQCLSGTHNIGFCNHSGCLGKCNQLATCGVRLDSNFCYTPGTQSIVVGNA